ncbi:hypothetical protein BOFE_00940 [Candidatus Borrelia fainii]|uniref:Uncharacterized protein n=1 Tax=Candidatus Borrelia fainii TaxID=2518322 RepID=A0ABM8DJ39_9SPIR|nr:hypothetical protein BOFE_00940 [Candidatus Borrelia fainii]
MNSFLRKEGYKETTINTIKKDLQLFVKLNIFSVKRLYHTNASNKYKGSIVIYHYKQDSYDLLKEYIKNNKLKKVITIKNAFNELEKNNENEYDIKEKLKNAPRNAPVIISNYNNNKNSIENSFTNKLSKNTITTKSNIDLQVNKNHESQFTTQLTNKRNKTACIKRLSVFNELEKRNFKELSR